MKWYEEGKAFLSPFNVMRWTKKAGKEKAI